MSSGTAVVVLSSLTAGVVGVMGMYAYSVGNFKKYQDGALGKLQEKVHKLVDEAETIMRGMDQLINKHKDKLLKLMDNGDMSKVNDFLEKIDKGASTKWLEEATECKQELEAVMDSGFKDENVALTDEDKGLITKLDRKIEDWKELFTENSAKIMKSLGYTTDPIERLETQVAQLKERAKIVLEISHSLKEDIRRAAPGGDIDKILAVRKNGEYLMKDAITWFEQLEKFNKAAQKIIDDKGTSHENIKRVIAIKNDIDMVTSEAEEELIKMIALAQSGGGDSKKTLKEDAAKEKLKSAAAMQERAEWLEYMKQKRND